MSIAEKIHRSIDQASPSTLRAIYQMLHLLELKQAKHVTIAQTKPHSAQPWQKVRQIISNYPTPSTTAAQMAIETRLERI